jgi:hypothetical protein
MANEMNFLDPQELKLSRPHRSRDEAAGALLLHQNGQVIVVTPPRRALPLSKPHEFIILVSESGEELGVLRSADDLDDDSRTILQEALDHAYKMEQITRVLEVDKEPLTGQIRWRVELIPATSRNAEENAGSGLAVTNTDLGEGNSEADDALDTGATEDTRERLGIFRRRVRSESTESDISVEEREFFIGGQEDVQTARYPHIYIVDTDRNRYEILDCEALDIESRRNAERYF